ncbi:divergent PAP2 family protein [Chungangia koreensis]|uniref:Divergent PAP2 family protein n=1 Tax=Chungangia koreensis TaxID=752657 RepID=A0ABV8X632_9LACT
MGILENTPIIASLLAILLAQFAKIPIHYLLKGKVEWKLFTSTGGMPSSHSAAVTALATAVGFETGFDSPTFAVATMFSVIVMFDATGVRFQAGQQALIINQMRLDFQTFVNEAKGWSQKNSNEKIKELKTLLGHKPSEVFAGALTGIFLSIVIYAFLK